MRLATLAVSALAVAAIGTAVAEDASATPNGLKLTAHNVVISSSLPHCAVEDASSGPVPCSWNIGPRDGNGHGLAYYVTRNEHFRYVWARSPLKGHDGRKWIGNRWADALESEDSHRNWHACWINVGQTTRVGCADGFKWVS